MSDVVTILPPNATAFERAAEKATARLGDVPHPLDTLWNPDTCPEAFLPWLAWALSVDIWKSDWPVATKRAAIKQSIAWHRRKGTVGAVRRALAYLGLEMVEIIEWWQLEAQRENYAMLQDRPYTFVVNVGMMSKPIDFARYDEFVDAIWRAKNLRSHLMELRLFLTQHSVAPLIALGWHSSEDTTLWPYVVPVLEQHQATYHAPAHYGAEVGYLYPGA